MKTIVGFGASSMGAGDPAGGFFRRLPAHPLLAGLSLDFKNHGIGGNTLKDMLARAPKAAALEPYDLIVIPGCNDLPRPPDSEPGKRSSPDECRSRVRESLGLVQGEKSLFITSFTVSPEKTGMAPELLEACMSEAMSAALSLGRETWGHSSGNQTRCGPPVGRRRAPLQRNGTCPDRRSRGRLDKREPRLRSLWILIENAPNSQTKLTCHSCCRPSCLPRYAS